MKNTAQPLERDPEERANQITGSSRAASQRTPATNAPV